MSDYSTRNRTFAAKAEDVSGVAETVTGASHAIRVENPTRADNWDLIENDEVTGSIGREPRQTGGGSSSRRVTAILKGSGAGGEAPEASALYQSLGLSETLLAADVTDVLQAGSTANTLVLADGDVGADGDYIGAPVRITTGAYAGYSGVVIGSVAATDTVTIFPAAGGAAAEGDGYTIDACAIYQPASTGQKTITGNLWQHPTTAGLQAILEQIVGAAGNATLTVPTRGVGRWAIDLQGKLVAPTAVTDPGPGTYDGLNGIVLVGATGYVGTSSIKWNEFSLAMNNEVSLADDPTEPYGYDRASVVRRRPGFRINPRLSSAATVAAFSDIATGTTRSSWLKWGTGDGGVFSLWMPAARRIAREDANVNGFAHDGADFDLGGGDTAFYACFA